MDFLSSLVPMSYGYDMGVGVRYVFDPVPNLDNWISLNSVIFYYSEMVLDLSKFSNFGHISNIRFTFRKV